MDKIIIYDNEFFEFYKINNNQLHVNSKSREIQEKNNSMPTEEKLKRLDTLLNYFYNFWIYVKENNETTTYTLNLDINLIMIVIPLYYFVTIANMFKSLKEILITNLKETNIKIDNNLTKRFFDMIFLIYKPVKPINII